MRILIISDVHANLAALNAVLADSGAFDRVWCLGDLVGYGPDPNECIERVVNLPGLQCVKGNHDAAILGEIDMSTFNKEARTSIRWLENQLGTTQRRWLEGLPDRLEFDDITLAHGSPRNPIWEYILDLRTALSNMKYFETKICLVGHTHIPGIFMVGNGKEIMPSYEVMLEDMAYSLERKCIVNPGSVGQPRDRDPRASYMVYDDEDVSWSFHRVAYDIEQVQKRIILAGLPDLHANRLSGGW